MECNKDMDVGLYEKKFQTCASCKQADPVNNPLIASATPNDVRETVRSELAAYDQNVNASGESFGTRVRRMMSSLAFSPRPTSAGSVEYYKDYGDRSAMRTRVTVLFSRGLNNLGVDQGKLEGFCVTQQVYVPAAKEAIEELGVAIAMDDIETIFTDLGLAVPASDIQTIERFECDWDDCEISTDEIFQYQDKKYCKQHFEEAVKITTPQVG